MAQNLSQINKQKGGENNDTGDSLSNMSGHLSCNEFNLKMRIMASLQ